VQRPPGITRHSLWQLQAVQQGEESVPRFMATPSSKRRGCFRENSLLHRQSALPDEFVEFQLVRDQATRRVEPAHESSPRCIPVRAGILQTARYAPQGRPPRLAPELFGSRTYRSRWACFHRHGADGANEYYVVACFLQWPEILGPRAITRHSQEGHIVPQRVRVYAFVQTRA